MLLSSFGAFSYFPYVSTKLIDYLGLPSLNIATVMAFGMFFGNTLAYIICLRVAEEAIKRVLWAGYAMALLAVASIAVAKLMPTIVAYCVVAGSIMLYRFAIGLSASLSRSLQMRYLPRREAKPLIFSYIKLCSSIAGALGPMAGSLVIQTYGFSGILALSSACFALSLLLLSCVRPPAAVAAGTESARHASLLAVLRSQPPMVFVVASTALLHFIFEAQIYSSIALNIQNNEKNYVDLIALLFSTNSVLLIIFVIPVLKVVNARNSTFSVLAFGSLMSLLSVVFSVFAHTPLEIICIAALFTVGEIITPQVMIDLATDCEQTSKSVGAMATFTFFTSGIGMSLGFWLGGLLPSLGSTLAMSAVWILVYVLFLIMAFYCTTQRRAVIGRQPASDIS